MNCLYELFPSSSCGNPFWIKVKLFSSGRFGMLSAPSSGYDDPSSGKEFLLSSGYLHGSSSGVFFG